MDYSLLTLRPRTAAALALVWLALGCDQLSGGAKKPAASLKSCEEFSARLCKETSDTSPYCKGIKEALPALTPEACATALTGISTSLKQIATARAKCDELSTKLCTDVGPTTPTCERVKGATAGFPVEQCTQMLSDYPQVLKSLQTQMEAMKRQEERLTKPIAPEEFAKMSAPDAPAFGPKDAKVTIVEFSDFQCPYCSRAANAVHSLKEKYSDKVHFVFRQFPLVSIHPNAQGAAEASLAAHAQNKFWEFHDKLFANQQQLTREALEGYAKELGLNVADFKKALDDKKFAPAVEAEVKLGTANSVDGTPTMFLNGKRVADPTNVAEISKQIDEALKS